MNVQSIRMSPQIDRSTTGTSDFSVDGTVTELKPTVPSRLMASQRAPTVQKSQLVDYRHAKIGENVDVTLTNDITWTSEIEKVSLTDHESLPAEWPSGLRRQNQANPSSHNLVLRGVVARRLIPDLPQPQDCRPPRQYVPNRSTFLRFAIELSSIAPGVIPNIVQVTMFPRLALSFFCALGFAGVCVLPMMNRSVPDCKR
ncbi:uncharacterized protein BT62DRAFT_1013666 [Guyanagaster necrorhizus]|uniref:Uncharacterized protein n=1 Tax=Guyanagaster necrorhizus TaxID=856835 RepID=A0A9P8AM96_9AGAR|nr:uncharacterized protein BT62DRAFT_1013666 [Guyanagaster necrorhizus MCA 3950]KAG7439627.1 hypothetical protein BT62DRAFT_1013666 [Guyanagaster necrorhizus MCA 3950]